MKLPLAGGLIVNVSVTSTSICLSTMSFKINSPFALSQFKDMIQDCNLSKAKMLLFTYFKNKWNFTSKESIAFYAFTRKKGVLITCAESQCASEEDLCMWNESKEPLRPMWSVKYAQSRRVKHGENYSPWFDGDRKSWTQFPSRWCHTWSIVFGGTQHLLHTVGGKPASATFHRSFPVTPLSYTEHWHTGRDDTCH